jgi:hypothetical protein
MGEDSCDRGLAAPRPGTGLFLAEGRPPPSCRALTAEAPCYLSVWRTVAMTSAAPGVAKDDVTSSASPGVGAPALPD